MLKKSYTIFTALVTALILINTALATGPAPDIKANNLVGPVYLSASDTLTVTVSLSPGTGSGADADWWLVYNTSSGWSYYDLTVAGFTSAGVSTDSILATHQGQLFDLGQTQVFNSTLSVGTYTFYFGVDTLKNGSLDINSLYYDSVAVSVSGSSTGGARDYKQDMRNFVQNISSYAVQYDPDFIIIPQNGHELLTEDGQETGQSSSSYISAIDGVGREDLFYGYNNDNEATPTSDKNYMLTFMDIAKSNGVEVLVTDYCSTKSYVDDSYSQSNAKDYISFAADQRELNNIPSYPLTPYNVNSSTVTTLSGAKNFLYLLNPSDTYSTKAAFISALKNTNYDVLIIDLFFGDTESLNASDVSSLKNKSNGGSRLVISYMSIGEAEDYRYYWQSGWSTSPPSWLSKENPDWPGNYKVKYWDSSWQSTIYGTSDSYLKRIIDAGFDGAYLDIIDAFEYFEDQ